MEVKTSSENKHLKGVRIRTLNLAMLLLSLALFVLVFYTTARIAREYSANIEATERFIAWEKAGQQLYQDSDYLVSQVRLFVQTGQRTYADNYFNELTISRSREKGLDSKSLGHVVEGDHACLETGLELSHALTSQELYIIRLMVEGLGEKLENYSPMLEGIRLRPADAELSREGKIALAREMVFSPAFIEAKRKIASAFSHFLDGALSRARLEQQEQSNKLGAVLQEQRIILVALCILNILTFLMIIVLIVKPLHIYLKCIRDDKMLELVGAYEFKHLALTYNDIFAVKEHQDRILRHRAEHDPLTGLLNRSAFDSLKALLETEPEPVGLILIDVDKFKEINDLWGHVVGDKTLCRVAWMLKRYFRQDDFCIRMGGDEFAVVLKEKSAGMEKIIAGKIKAINESLRQGDSDLPAVSLSVGVAFSESGFPESLYAKADKALYQVKERGRCGVAFYEEEGKGENGDS